MLLKCWQLIFEGLSHEGERPHKLTEHELTALVPHHHLVHVVGEMLNLLTVEDIFVNPTAHTTSNACSAHVVTSHTVPVKW